MDWGDPKKKAKMSTARTETRTSSWRAPTLRGLRQSLTVTRRAKPSVEEPLQLDANGLRKALQIGSDLIASPIVDHVRQQRAVLPVLGRGRELGEDP